MDCFLGDKVILLTAGGFPNSSHLFQVAKLAIYAKCQRLCDATFILFSVIFIVTRLGIYPFW